MPVIFASSLLILPSSSSTWLRQHLRAGAGPSTCRDAVRAAGLPLQHLLHRADLLLLLLLDGHHLQPEGHGQQPQGLRQLHPRLPARQADGRLPGTGADADHLRRGGVPGGRRHHPEPDLERRWKSTTAVASFYGGTGLLIVISVALDLVQKINSHLVMRNYPGLTED